MKTRIPALLLCLAMLAALVPTGILSIPAAAAPDNNFCKTENVEVPDGWDYVEVSNGKDLLATEERHGGWDSDGKPMFVRLTADISLSAGDVGQYERACLQLSYWTSTIIDFNGHTIRCYINAELNGDNRTWYGVVIYMNYGLVPNQYLRLVDSAGGGGITLDARTDVDGPTNALRIQGQSMKRYAPPGYQAYYTETRPTVYIDGGYYGMTTYNKKFCGVQGDPLNDSNGYPRWAVYIRSAVGLYYCSAVINNGHFCAEYDKDASGVSADMGKRFLSDFGYLDVDHLAINGGLFNGSCYSVMTYQTLSCYYDDLTFKQMIPVINGGEFHGGIQLCTTRTSYWRKLQGCYDLSPVMKDIKVSEALYPGAKMYMDGKLIDPNEKDLEDIAWPHLITVTPGPHIIKTKLLDENLATGCYTGYHVQYNKMPDSAILQEYITVIRLGEEQSYWTEVKGSYYTLQTNLGENYLNFFVPARDTAGTRRYRVRATFGDITILSDEFEVYWMDFVDFKFTEGPDWHDGGGSGVAYVDFDISYRHAMWHYKLYWLVHGDYWQSIDDAPYLTPEKNKGLYRFYLPQIAENDSDSTTYCIIVTYILNGVVYNIYSDEFTLYKSDIGAPMDPDGVGLDCTECVLGVGESKTVNVTLFPTSAPHKEGFTVKSSDTGVAQTSAADGCFTIKANKAGTATITVTAKGGAFAECKVTVFNSSFVPGDVNGDGTVNNKDVVLLFRYVSGADVEVNIAALDVNGDGSVNNKDVVTLFKYVSGADITLSGKPYTTTP